MLAHKRLFQNQLSYARSKHQQGSISTTSASLLFHLLGEQVLSLDIAVRISQRNLKEVSDDLNLAAV